MSDTLEKSFAAPELPAHSPEQEPASEREKNASESGAAHEERPKAQPAHAPTSAIEPVAPVTPADPVMESIEKILADDLMDFFASMSPQLQQNFKQKGDETAGKIRTLMSRATVKAKEILKLIVDWLKLIPGANKFFIEQESKIKTDKLIELHKREHGS